MYISACLYIVDSLLVYYLHICRSNRMERRVITSWCQSLWRSGRKQNIVYLCNVNLCRNIMKPDCWYEERIIDMWLLLHFVLFLLMCFFLFLQVRIGYWMVEELLVWVHLLSSVNGRSKCFPQAILLCVGKKKPSFFSESVVTGTREISPWLGVCLTFIHDYDDFASYFVTRCSFYIIIWANFLFFYLAYWGFSLLQRGIVTPSGSVALISCVVCWCASPPLPPPPPLI